MRLLLLLIVVFVFLNSSAQQESELKLQAQVVDMNKRPVADAYIFNTRSSAKMISSSNGIFDASLLPKDTLIVTHISFIRKVVTAYELMVNPVIELELDTVNIRQINITGSQRTEYDLAMKNIDRIDFDFRTQPSDNFTEAEKMQQLMKTEDRVQRVAASSITLYSFSPSQLIGNWIDKRKKKKEARQFSSTKENQSETEK